ncbi:hypothetical protein [Gracilibacillus salinarum]|uniref:DUF2802 domain-containing protein n=1 Tax=Gracilibacillus salinarum TaxID=2932255 RepID=A0ABY4GQQ8_9BACI|nr:hypothetical protein [Gracilibacillus salinarum]UOQ86012.1 hypothetical protein MUN87_03650 [Gracilibacillus salinarum]
MYFAIGAIIIIAIILWILSFFTQDKFKQLEDQLEQFSISTLQETYQLKKKVSILEEELLINDETVEQTMSYSRNETPVMKKVKELHQQGHHTAFIAEKVQLNEYDVMTMIKQL